MQIPNINRLGGAGVVADGGAENGLRLWPWTLPKLLFSGPPLLSWRTLMEQGRRTWSSRGRSWMAAVWNSLGSSQRYLSSGSLVKVYSLSEDFSLLKKPKPERGLSFQGPLSHSRSWGHRDLRQSCPCRPSGPSCCPCMGGLSRPDGVPLGPPCHLWPFVLDVEERSSPLMHGT